MVYCVVTPAVAFNDFIIGACSLSMLAVSVVLGNINAIVKLDVAVVFDKGRFGVM